MTNLRELFRDPKEREDVIIGIVVLLLFLGPMLYYLFGRTIETVEDTVPIAEQIDVPEEIAAVTAVVTNNLDSDADELTEKDFKEETSTDKKLNTWIDSLSTNKISSTTSKITPSEFAIANPIKKGKEAIDKAKEKVPPVIKESEGDEFESKTKPIEKAKEEAPVVKEKEETISKPTESNTEANAIKTPSKEEVIKSIKSDNNTTKKSSSATKPVPTTSNNAGYDCFVVLGAFKKLENSKSMVQQIKQRKYPVYTGRQQGYHIVGVNCKCSESNTVLPQLRRDFTPEAFLVKRD